jgi:hypothetical protein
MHQSRRALFSALVTAAAILGVAAGPAAADTAGAGVLKTPKVPVVIDGVRHAPQAIHRFDGQNVHLKLRRGPSGKP